MNNDSGPDILGVCEVENKPVMDRLVTSLNSLNRNYKVAHHDCSDERGIDVAFIYDGDKFTFKRARSKTAERVRRRILQTISSRSLRELTV